ncbi:DUF1205 domain-containing protein, partial [Streptomyces sp. SID11233]|nr:DUF1205 domain-containing protein [Streptomyces sp. SID11233]
MIQLAPPAMTVPASLGQTEIPMRYVPYNGSGALPPWLRTRSQRPRVCVTSGLALGGFDKETAADAMRAFVGPLAGLDIEVVLAGTADQRDLAAGLPGGARFAESPPFHQLLPSCDAVIHHGGAGTAMTAVHAGVPQVILPQSPPHTEIAYRVEQAGAGVVV